MKQVRAALKAAAEEGTAVEKPSPHIDGDGESEGSAIPAGAGLLLVVATLLVAGLCAYRRRQKGRHARAVSQLYDDMAAASGETPWFETRVYIEHEDISCDFTMRVEYAELSSRELLLECIARAAFEATEISFDFSTATLERLERKGHATVVKTDRDCRSIRSAAGLRVSTGRHAGFGTPKAMSAAPSASPGTLPGSMLGLLRSFLFKSDAEGEEEEEEEEEETWKDEVTLS